MGIYYLIYRPAPKPPNHEQQNLHIRGPSELLLGVPTGLQTQWRHKASTLVLGVVRYDVNVSQFFFSLSLFVVF